MTVKISMRIREVRRTKGLTLMELSKMSGVSKTHISEIETGRQMPTLPVICLLAGAMEVKAEELYTYTIEK